MLSGKSGSPSSDFFTFTFHEFGSLASNSKYSVNCELLGVPGEPPLSQVSVYSRSPVGRVSEMSDFVT